MTKLEQAMSGLRKKLTGVYGTGFPARDIKSGPSVLSKPTVPEGLWKTDPPNKRIFGK